jgi:hypothetical protein
MEEVLGAKVYHPRDGNVKGVAVEEGQDGGKYTILTLRGRAKGG